MTSPRKGGCLCGAVRFSARLASLDVSACHCSMCRGISSGAEYSLHAAPADAVRFEGEALRVWQSSEVAERGFCSICGSGLFWRRLDGSEIALSAGAFDSDEGFSLADEIFCESKPGYYAYAGAPKKLIGYGPEEAP